MKAHSFIGLCLLLGLSLIINIIPQDVVNAQMPITGGVNILSVLPKKICIGDTITLNGAASITNIEDVPPPLAWLPVTKVNIKARNGSVTPEEIIQPNDGFYFDITYKATTPGTETLTLSVNDGVAFIQEHFEVEEKCDYDAFLTNVMYFTTDLDGEIFQSITHVTGTGTMKRDREGSQFYQGDGNWHLEEIILSKPSFCVEYYAPPLITNGPFELDGRLADEGDTVDVILSFLPRQGEVFRHGDVVCVDENGDVGIGWGVAQGGDPSMAAKIEAEFLTGGGAKNVELQGAGMNLVQSMGTLDYTATLTLIPR